MVVQVHAYVHIDDGDYQLMRTLRQEIKKFLVEHAGVKGVTCVTFPCEPAAMGKDTDPE